MDLTKVKKELLKIYDDIAISEADALKLSLILNIISIDNNDSIKELIDYEEKINPNPLPF